MGLYYFFNFGPHFQYDRRDRVRATDREGIYLLPYVSFVWLHAWERADVRYT